MYEDYPHPLYDPTSLPPAMTQFNTWHYPVYYLAHRLMILHLLHSLQSFVRGYLPLWRLNILVTSVTVDLSQSMSRRDNDIVDKMQIRVSAAVLELFPAIATTIGQRNTRWDPRRKDSLEKSKAWKDMVGAPRFVNGKADVCPPEDLRYDNRSQCPLGYTPC